MKKIKELLSFKRPSGPGFGISAGYYLSVLTGTAVMPSVKEVVNPKGEGGAVPGFGVPLAGSSKDDLDKPMERGVYAIASVDRKTVLKTMVLSKEEAGFDPEVFVRLMGRESSPELTGRVRSTWQLVQFTFESYDPEVWPAVDFLLGVAGRMGGLTRGVVADPVSRVYKLPEEVLRLRVEGGPFSVWDVIWPQFRPVEGGVHVYTLGMQKFGLPEFEVSAVGEDVQEKAGQLLMSLAHEALKGTRLGAGDKVGSGRTAFVIAEGGLDRGVWEGTACLEVIPEAGDLSQVLREWNPGQ